MSSTSVELGRGVGGQAVLSSDLRNRHQQLILGESTH